MSNVTQILNWISDSLLLPIIVLLLAALVVSLISLGGFCSTYIMLLRERKKRDNLIKSIKHNGKISEAELRENGGVFAQHVQELMNFEWDEIECEKRISEILQGYERDLEKSKFLTKIAPMLGLTGTLIPMGPALAGLASGDIANMAYNMRIAFATTVIGCLVAGISLLIYSVKKHWYSEEIANLRYVLDRHLRDN